MRPLRYSINVTLDGCCHHEAGMAISSTFAGAVPASSSHPAAHEALAFLGSPAVAALVRDGHMEPARP